MIRNIITITAAVISALLSGIDEDMKFLTLLGGTTLSVFDTRLFAGVTEFADAACCTTNIPIIGSSGIENFIVQELEFVVKLLIFCQLVAPMSYGTRSFEGSAHG